jgi:hypothetical protein
MREELTEPQHWRVGSGKLPSWSSCRRAATKALPAELVDAAFTDEGSQAASRLDAAEVGDATKGECNGISYPELIASLSSQLDQLETHREQIKKLLAEASDRQA